MSSIHIATEDAAFMALQSVQSYIIQVLQIQHENTRYHSLINAFNQLLLPSPRSDLALFAYTKGDSTVWAVPFSRAWWNLRKTNTLEMKPLFLTLVRNQYNIGGRRIVKTYICVLATDHDAKAYAIAETISCFIWINDITLIINLVPDLS